MARRSLLLLVLLVGSLLRIVYAQWPTETLGGVTIPLASLRLTYRASIPSTEYSFYVINVTLPTTIQEQLKNLCDTYDRASVDMYGTYKACRFIYPYRILFVEKNAWLNPVDSYYIDFRDDGIPIRYYFVISKDYFILGVTNTMHIFIQSPHVYVPTSWRRMYRQGYLLVMGTAGSFDITPDVISYTVWDSSRMICYTINKTIDLRYPIAAGIRVSSARWGSAAVIFDLVNRETGELSRIAVYADVDPARFVSGIRYKIDGRDKIVTVQSLIYDDISKYDLLYQICFMFGAAYGYEPGSISVSYMYVNYRTLG